MGLQSASAFIHIDGDLPGGIQLDRTMFLGGYKLTIPSKMGGNH